MISALLANVRSLYQTAGCLLPVVEEKQPNLIGIVESWEKENNPITLPTNYQKFSNIRKDRRAGGIQLLIDPGIMAF